MVGRTSGVHATGVHPTGAIRVSGRTRLRCPRPRRPRCPHRAGSWHASVRRGRPRLGASGSTCRCGRRAAGSSLPESGLAGRGWLCVGSAWLARGSTGDLGRRSACAQAGGAAFAAWPTKGAGPAPGCRSVGWEYEKEQVLTSPPQVRPEQVAGVMADHRLAGSGDHAPWSLCCVGPWRSAPEGPIRFGGEQAAAAARPRQVRSAVRQELTAR
jgi:hypothetical protein